MSEMRRTVCEHCHGTGYAIIPAGATPCIACETGRRIGNRPKRKRKAPRASKAQETAKPRPRWKEWDETMESMS